MNPRILLLDDDVTVHQALELRLRRFGSLTGCLVPEQALEAARSRQFDVALIDVNLGEGLSGTQFVSLLREVDADLTPVIFTAFDDHATARASIEAHSFDFVPKTLGDDDSFFDKLSHAAARTREQREKSQGLRSAGLLQGALTNAKVGRELGLSELDIQAGLLDDTLDCFSAVLGQVELIEARLRRPGLGPKEIAETARLSGEAIAGLHAHLERLRDYLADPERSARSLNAMLAEAARQMERDSAEAGGHCPVAPPQLKPDHLLGANGRALLRAVVVLSRLLRSLSPKTFALSLGCRRVHNPAVELRLIRAAGRAAVLCAPDFARERKGGVEVEIAAPGARLGDDRVARLLRETEQPGGGASIADAVALVARLGGALLAEGAPRGGARFRIILV